MKGCLPEAVSGRDFALTVCPVCPLPPRVADARAAPNTKAANRVGQFLDTEGGHPATRDLGGEGARTQGSLMGVFLKSSQPMTYPSPEP